MATVQFTTSEALDLTGGLREVEVEAETVRRMILELDRRFPGLGERIERRMAVAIDGEIHQDNLSARIGPGTEVCLIPRIGGG